MYIDLSDRLYQFSLDWQMNYDKYKNTEKQKYLELKLKYKELQSIFPNTDIKYQLQKRAWWVDSMQECLT